MNDSLPVVIKILFVLAFVFCVLKLAVPSLQNILFRLKRYKIGAWYSEDEWKEAVTSLVGRWIEKSPVITINESNDIFKKRSSAAVQSWQEAELLIACKCTKNDLEKYNETAVKKLETFLRQSRKIDLASLGFAILYQNDYPENYKATIDEIIKLIESNMDDSGLISYSQGKQFSSFYVDTLGMICPFLTIYGKVFQKSYYQDLAYKQLKYYHDNGLFQDSNLPCHAIDKVSHFPLGVYGWGRGTAWYIISLLDSVEYFDNANQKKEIFDWLHNAADSYLKYQASDGGFNYIIQAGVNYDSSVTATMAYFYIKCYKYFSDIRYFEAYQKCVHKLMTVTMRDGAIDLCQGDTFGLGIFSRMYDIMPFAQGLTVRALKEAEKS